MAAKSEGAKARQREANRERMRRLRADGAVREPAAAELTPAQLEKRRARSRRYHGRNAGKRREQSRQWRKEHPEQVKANKRKSWTARKQDPAVRAKANAALKRFAHGPGFDAMWAELWDSQQGLCYLCENPLVPGFDTHVDHDHACCPKGRTCSFCRRGLACSRCNTLIGAAEDNPDLLRRIADNLEPVLERTRARIATKPQQGELWEEAS